MGKSDRNTLSHKGRGNRLYLVKIATDDTLRIPFGKNGVIFE